MKQLSNRFPQVAEHFSEYQRGVTVVHLYNLDEPKSGWVRDGLIRSFYFRSDEDRVEVVRLGDKTELRNQDGILKPKFGFESKDAFLASTSSIVYYLRDKLGLD
jgi:hypothetical protein